ncbi:hypothetical protein [Phytohalomonas tamaricis]|uniref:hypothetical protein n=1 Tax=Phytohalomonas tamaricis TaxID=2081032 RepID=UPI000D0AF946|nr:hypothetical protein [Phytohalomonas tamaricis]
MLPDESGAAVWEQRIMAGFTFTYQDKPAPETDMPATNWLSWDIEALWGECEKAEICPEEGMKIKIRGATGIR